MLETPGGLLRWLTAAQAALLPTQPISTQINLGLLLWLDEKRGSRQATLTRLAGSRITCMRTGQSYQRVTAICHNSSGVEINCAMVESGVALIWDRFNRQQPICRS